MAEGGGGWVKGDIGGGELREKRNIAFGGSVSWRNWSMVMMWMDSGMFLHALR